MDTLLYFVALLYGHNPQFRNNLSSSETTLIKQMLKGVPFPIPKVMNLISSESVMQVERSQNMRK